MNDRKSVNISNIDQYMIVQSRELSRCQNPILEVVSVYMREELEKKKKERKKSLANKNKLA
ncbi:MAG: hypothetical protein Tsb0021_17980 [Chlamydiales bacterium]